MKFRYVLSILLVVLFKINNIGYSQCANSTASGTYCAGQYAEYKVTDASTTTNYHWYELVGTEYKDRGYGLDGAGRNFVSVGTVTGPTTYYYSKEIDQTIVPSIAPAGGTTQLMTAGKYAMPFSSTTDFRLNSVEVVVSLTSATNVYGFQIMYSNTDSVQTFSEWYTGTRDEFTSLGGNLYRVIIPVTGISISKGIGQSLEFRSVANAGQNVAVDGIYWWNNTGYNGGSYASNSIVLTDPEKSIGGTVRTPLISNWEITTICDKVGVTSTLSGSCCTPVGTNFVVRPGSYSTFPTTLTASGTDITTAGLNYYWYNESNTLIGSGVDKKTQSISSSGIYTLKVVRNAADLNKFSCVGKKTFEIENKAIKAIPDTTICIGDPFLLSAYGAEGNYSWSSPNAIANASIVSKDNQKTAINLTTPGKYTFVVGGDVKLGNVAYDGKFDKYDDRTNYNIVSYPPSFETTYGNTTSNPTGAFITNNNQFRVDKQIKAWSSNQTFCNTPAYWTKTDPISGDVVDRGNIYYADANTSGTEAAYTEAYGAAHYLWQLSNQPVKPNTDYEFAMDVSEWNSSTNPDIMLLVNGVALPLFVNNVQVTTVTKKYWTFDGTPCTWKTLVGKWNSGSNTTATITVSEVSKVNSGHEFAMDDITFSSGRGTQYDTVEVTIQDCFSVVADVDSNKVCSGGEITLSATTNGFIEKWETSAGTLVGNTPNVKAYPIANTIYTVTAKFPIKNIGLNYNFQDGFNGFTSGYNKRTDTQFQNGDYLVVKGNESYLTDVRTGLTDRDGNGYLLITKGANDQNAKVLYSQTVSVTNGKQYGISFYLQNIMANLANSAPVNLELRINDVKVLDINQPLTNNWEYYSYLWTAVGTTAKIDIVGRNTFSDYKFRLLAFDDIVIAEAGLTKYANVSVSTKDCNTIIARQDTSVCSGKDIVLSATTNGFVTKWTPSTGLSDPSAPTPILTVSSTQTYIVEAQFPIQKYITNSDFNAGNTGFTSGLTNRGNQNPGNNNEYIIGNGNDTNLNYPFVKPTRDHTTGTGTGLFMIAKTNSNGVSVVINQTIATTIGESYAVSFWATDMHQQFGNSSPITFQIRIGGVVMKTVTIPQNRLWNKIEYAWTATTAANVLVEIINPQETNAKEHAFGLDDLSIVKLGNKKNDSVVITAQDCNTLIPMNPPGDICIGDPVRLTATTNGYITQWTPTATLDNPASSSPRAYPIANITYTVEAQFPIAKLVTNPDFENGFTGHSTSLQAGTAGQYAQDNQYVITKGTDTDNFYRSTKDHTSGNGFYMASKVKTDADRVILSRTIPVVNGTFYGLSFYITNIASNMSDIYNALDAEVQVKIGGTVVKLYKAPQDRLWHLVDYTWKSTVTGNVTVEIVSLKASGVTRYIGIDDFSVSTLGNPKTRTVTITTKDCFVLTAVTNGPCQGDSIQVTATTTGLFAGWKVKTGTATIKTPNSLTTWVKPTTATTLEISAEYPLGNLVQNGDFEGAVGEGYTSGYQYREPTIDQGYYTLTTNSNSPNTGYFFKIPDHTTGDYTGKMMVIDPNSQPNVSAYATKVTVKNGVKYAFSVWVASLHNQYVSPPLLQFFINNGTTDIPLGILDADSLPIWRQFYSTWTSNVDGEIELKIVNRNTSGGGNDFAIDDIEFTSLNNPRFFTLDVPACVVCKAGKIDADQSICYNTVPAGFTNQALPTLGSATPNYQWEKSTGNSNSFTNATGASATTQAFSESALLTQTTFYRRKEFNSTCPSGVYSDTVKVTVLPPVIAGTISSSQSICTGTKPAPFTETIVPTGGTGSFTYQWEKSIDSINFDEITVSGTSKTYTEPNNLTTNTWYKRRVSSGTCATTTDINDFTTGTGVNQFNFIGTWNTSTGGGKYQSDDHYSSTTNASYEVSFYGTQVQLFGKKAAHHGIFGVRIDGGTEQLIDMYSGVLAEDNLLLYTSPVLPLGNHKIVVRVTGTKNAASSGFTINADRIRVISGIYTNTIKVTVNPKLTITGTKVVCVGATSQMTGSATSGTWASAIPSVATITSTGLVRGISAGTTDITYNVNGCIATETITVNPKPDITAKVDKLAYCEGDNMILSYTNATGNTATIASQAWTPSAPSVTTATYSKTKVKATDAVLYTVIVTSDLGCKDTSTVTPVINVKPDITAKTDKTAYCENETMVLSYTNAPSNSAVLASQAWTPSSPSVTTATFTKTNVKTADAIDYTVIVVSDKGCRDTVTVKPTINPNPTITANATKKNLCSGEKVTLTGSGANTYVWDNGVSNGVEFTPTITRKYTVTGTATNTCKATDTVTVTVNALPVVGSISSLSPICEDGTRTLSISGSRPTSTYTWTLSGTGVSPTSGTGSTLNITAGTGNISVSVSEVDANNCASTAPATGSISVDRKPPLAQVSSNALTVCALDAVKTLNATAVALPSRGIWTKEAGSSANASIADVNNPGSSITIGGGETLVAKWTVTSGLGVCTGDSKTVTVTATSAVTASVTLSADTTICLGGSVRIKANPVNGGTSPDYVLTPGNISNQTGIFTVNPSTTQSYTVEMTSKSSCVATKVVNSLPQVVTVVTPPTADITDPNTAYNVNYNVNKTGSDNVPLTANAITIGYVGTWSIISGQGNINANTGVLSGLAAKEPNPSDGSGTTRVKWTVRDNANACRAAADSVTIVNVDKSVPNAGPDKTICTTDLPLVIDGLPTTLIPTIETASWTVKPVGSSVNAKLTIPSNTPAGTYTFAFEIDNTVAGKSTDNVTITIVAPPTADITDPATSFNVSYNVNKIGSDNLPLTANAPTAGYAGTWSIISGQGSINANTGVLTGLSVKEPTPSNGTGTTRVKWTVRDIANACKAAADSVTIVNVDKNIPNAGPDRNICTTSLPLVIDGLPTSLIPGIETASWTVKPVGTSVDAKLTIPAGTPAGTYTFTFEIDNSVTGKTTDDVVVRIDEETDQPTFSAIGAGPFTSASPYVICTSSLTLAGDPNTQTLGKNWWTLTSGTGTLPAVGDSTVSNPSLSGISGQVALNYNYKNGVCGTKSTPIVIEKLGDLTKAVAKLNGGKSDLSTKQYSAFDLSVQPGRLADTLCLGGTYTLRADQIKTTETGAWSTVGVGTSVVSTPVDAITRSLTAATVGTTVLKWKVSSNLIATCQPDSIVMTFVVRDAPTASISAINPLCEETEGDAAVTVTSDLSNYKISWRDTTVSTAKAALVGTANQATARYKFTSTATTGLTDANGFVRAQVANACGRGFAQQTVTLNLKPRVVADTIGGGGGIICSSNTGATFGLRNQGASITGYAWSFNGVAVPSTTFPQADTAYVASSLWSDVNYDALGLAEVQVVVTLSNACGAGASKDTNVFIKKAMPLVATLVSSTIKEGNGLSGSQRVCLPNQKTRFTAGNGNGIALADASYAFTRTRDGVPVPGGGFAADSLVFEAGQLEDGDEVTVRVSSTKGCFTGGGTSGPSSAIKVDGYRIDTSMVVYGDTALDNKVYRLCDDKRLYLSVRNASKGNNYYKWYRDGVSASVDSSETDRTTEIGSPSQTGRYHVEISNDVCGKELGRYVEVRVYEKPDFFFTVDPLIILFEEGKLVPMPVVHTKPAKDDSATVKASWESEPSGYERWLLSKDSLSPLIRTEKEQTEFNYALTVTTGTKSKAYCSTTKSLRVINSLPLDIPNAFSPNGDGVNDTWVIKGMNKYASVVVSVFNRWGSRVFYSNGGYAPWDGNVNGLPVASGTYYAIIELKGSPDNTDTNVSQSLTIVK